MNEEELEDENVLGDTESETESTIDESVDQAPKEYENVTSDEDTKAEKVDFHEFDDVEKTNIDSSNNLDMLKDVNVEVSVELGRITMPLGDVLNLSKGSVVELENLAGEQINVLDLGCGDQLIKKPFEKNNFFYKGLDIQDLDIEKDNFPIEDNSIDIIISVGLIEALKTTENLFKESLRVLKKGGYIYLITPNWLKDYKNFYRNPFHKKPFTPDSLENILHLSGFQDIKTFPGLRCKPKWYYQGKYRFEKAYYLLPFSGVNFINHESKVIDNKWIPDFLKGHARSIIAVAKK